MQRMAKTLLFFYPAVRWLSSRLRHEREFRCDELAAEAAGNRRMYASVLEYTNRAKLATNCSAFVDSFGKPKAAMPARLRHVLDISSPPKRSRYWLAGVLTPAAVITLGIGAQIALTGSDAKAKTISESARQTAVRSADIDNIKKLAGQLANGKNIATSKVAWDEWTNALASAKALIEQQPAGEMHVFEPLFEPLFSKVGWGGVIRRESRTAADLLVRIGKPAVGFLLEKLKSTEARRRWSAIQILTEIGEPDAPVVSAIRPLLSDKDDYVRRVAIESLCKLGENARPAAEDLKAAFNDTSVINRIFARAAYIRIGRSKPEHIRAIAKYLESHDTKDEVGFGSAAAVAASVLGDLGPVAIIAAPDLTAALNHPQSQIRINAAGALGRIGADSNQAIDALIDRLKNDTSRQVRRSAAASLGRIGPKAQDAIPVLAKVLREADKESRNDRKTDRTGWWVAARAVGQIGGVHAIPVLEESLKNNDPDIRSTAAKALEKIQQEAKIPPTPPDTQPVEKIGEPALVDAAAKAMESLPAQNSFKGITVSIKAKKSVCEPGSLFGIVGTISTDREHTMYNACWDLKIPVPGRLFVYDEAGSQILEFYDPRYNRGYLTGATKSACRKYKPGETQQIFVEGVLLFDISPDCPLPPGRYKVQLALNGLLLWEPQQYVAPEEVPEGLDRQMVAYSNVVHIEIKGEPAFQPKTLTQWIEALKDEDPYVRCFAAFTLGKLRDERALPGLIEALKDKKRSVRRNAALALGELRDQTAIDPLLVALKKESLEFRIRPGSVREGMGLALLKIGKEDVEPFIKRLEKGDGEVRIIIIGVLAKLKAKRAVEPLIPLLKDYSKGVRNAAAYALGKIDDERAVEPLIAALKDKDQWVRIGAASSLGMIGDKRAVEPLISLLNDERAGSYAASALGEIKDKRALEPLIKSLNHKSSWTRDCSAEALGKMKDARAVEPLIAALKVTKPRYYQRKQPTVTDERAVRDLRGILRDEREKPLHRHRVAWALVEIGQPAIDPLTGALQSEDKWLSGAAAVILEKIQASPAAEPGTPMQSRQGKLEKQLDWLASEADLVVVAENPWQYDRLYARQVLKGSKVSFSNIQEIEGIEKPPTDKNKQWILFLRIEQDHNLLLSPVTPGGWFAPYSEELAQRVIAAIPLPDTWGETRDGLRMGLRLRKYNFDVGEDIPVEICIQNVSKKAVTLYQHRYNNREYDYYPFTRLVVEFSDGRRLELYKPTLFMSDMDSPSPRTLSPGETYIHTVRLNKWTDWYEPAPKPGEKVELFTPGTFKIICTYSVGKTPPMVPEPAQPKNAWFGTLTSAPIKLKIVEAKSASVATQPTVTERYVLNDMPGEPITIPSFGGGSGEPSDPYLIYTAEQFNTIGLIKCIWDKHFLLCANIDLAGFTGTSFNVIGTDFDNPFTGVFDGNGHKISNFSYTSTDTNSVGLFGYVTGEINNFGLIYPYVDAGTCGGVGSLVGWLINGNITACYAEEAGVSGHHWVGGLVGRNGGTITNCYSTADVSGTGWDAGGLVGQNDATISNCYSTASVSGNKYVGGLLGENCGKIFDCYSEGVVSGTTNIGGLAGRNYYGIISNSYSTASVSGKTNVGGLMGANYGEVICSFWDIETSGQTTSAGGTGKTTAEMQTISTFTGAGWDFVGETVDGIEDIWFIPQQDYPRLWWQTGHGRPRTTGQKASDPNQVKTAEERCAMLPASLTNCWHDARVVHDVASFRFNQILKEPDRMWVLMRITPDTSSGIFQQRRPFTLMMSGSWKLIAALTKAPDRRSGRYGWEEPINLFARVISIEDLYNIFRHHKEGGSIICRYNPKAKGADQFASVCLIPRQWEEYAGPAVTYLQQNLERLRQKSPQVTNDLRVLLDHKNPFVAVTACNLLAERNGLDKDFARGSLAGAEGYRQAIFTYVLLIHSLQMKQNQWFEELSHVIEMADNSKQLAGAALSIFASFYSAPVPSRIGREARLKLLERLDKKQLKFGSQTESDKYIISILESLLIRQKPPATAK